MKNENEKLSKFSEILSKMRKERGVSQKSGCRFGYKSGTAVAL